MPTALGTPKKRLSFRCQKSALHRGGSKIHSLTLLFLPKKLLSFPQWGVLICSLEKGGHTRNLILPTIHFLLTLAGKIKSSFKHHHFKESFYFAPSSAFSNLAIATPQRLIWFLKPYSNHDYMLLQ